MDKKNIYWIAAVTVLAIVWFVIWAAKQPGITETPTNFSSDSEIVYFYGEGCSHCKKVSEFFEQNKIAEKVSFVKKEVWSNKNNNAEMEFRAKQCNVKPEGMGVPFLFAKGKCFVGDIDVIDFFKKEAGIR